MPGSFFLTEYLKSSIEKVFKAPRRYLYVIHNISFASAILAEHRAYILDHGKHQLESFTRDDLASQAIFMFTSSTTGGSQHYNINDFKTKFITIATETGFSGRILVTINVTLVKASRSDLILEYLRKSR